MKIPVRDQGGMLKAFQIIGKQEPPYTITIKEGVDRSLNQNRTAWLWAKEIAKHLGDRHADEVHAYNKLHFGVPIRFEDDGFRAAYDRIIRPLPYIDQIEIMGPPINLPVTRDMGVKQMTRFLDAVRQHWTQQGVALTDPDPMETT